MVTIIMAKKPKIAAVHVGTYVTLNFVKFARDFERVQEEASFSNMVVTVTWQGGESDKPIVLSSPVTVKPPNLFLVTLEKVSPQNEGIYKVETCIKQDCVLSTATLVVITGKVESQSQVTFGGVDVH